MTRVWALVPIKNLAHAKSRLAPSLDDAMRRRLVLAMARDVLSALAVVQAVERVLIVSDAPEAAELARRFRIGLLNAGVGKDLNDDLSLAAVHAARGGAGEVLIVHADLPLLGAPAVARFLGLGPATAGAMRMRAAPCKHGNGTNLLLAPVPLPVPLLFGQASLAGFKKAVREAGGRLDVVRERGLAMDIDTAEDFQYLAALHGAGHLPAAETARLLEALGEFRDSA